MNLLDEIKNDCVNDAPISQTLRKAKILASALNSTELDEWVERELDGYPSVESVPEYRKFAVILKGDFGNGYWKALNVSIPMLNLPDWMQDLHLDEMPAAVAAPQIEVQVREQAAYMSAGNTDGLRYPLSADLIPLLHNRVIRDYNCYGAWRQVPVGALENILHAIRNRLLDFVLELEKRHPDANVPGMGIPKAEVARLVEYHFEGGSHTIGGNVTQFNQQNQKVNTQYNAGHDINFGDVASRDDYISALEQLKNQISASDLEEGVKTDAEYHVTKAVQESKKPEPDKKTLADHLEQARAILKDGAAVASLLIAAQGALDTVHKFFH